MANVSLIICNHLHPPGAALPFVLESIVKKVSRWFVVFLLFSSMASFSLPGAGCAGNACVRFYQELKTRCRLTSTKEGAKLDQYLQQTFTPCQLEICARSSKSDIDCLDAATHIPGGINGTFLSCQ